jgi:hypothetical protein
VIQTIRTADDLRAACVAKLNPKAIKLSGRFGAILACMLGEKWTEPSYAGLTVTSDGHLLGMLDGDIGFNDYIGVESDLLRNVAGVADAADLDADEKAHLLGLARALRFKS